MSQTYLSTIVMVLAVILPKLGINVGSEELTNALQTFIVILSGLWILIRRYQAGGINALGARV